MKTEIIKSEKINRESLDLDIVRIDEIKDKPGKLQEVDLNEKTKIEKLSQAILTEEASEFKRTKAMQKAKNESCYYRWCICISSDDD
jgi:hypothetical protein